MRGRTRSEHTQKNETTGEMLEGKIQISNKCVCEELVSENQYDDFEANAFHFYQTENLIYRPEHTSTRINAQSSRTQLKPCYCRQLDEHFFFAQVTKSTTSP